MPSESGNTEAPARPTVHITARGELGAAAQARFELDLEHCPNCGGQLKIIELSAVHRVVKLRSRDYGGMVYQQCGSTGAQPQETQYIVFNPSY